MCNNKNSSLQTQRKYLSLSKFWFLFWLPPPYSRSLGFPTMYKVSFFTSSDLNRWECFLQRGEALVLVSHSSTMMSIEMHSVPIRFQLSVRRHHSWALPHVNIKFQIWVLPATFTSAFFNHIGLFLYSHAVLKLHEMLRGCFCPFTSTSFSQPRFLIWTIYQ